MNNENQLEAILRVPCKEQYSYIELKLKGSQEEIIRTYLSFTDKYKKLLKEWEADKPPF